jgi:uncharacterized protein (DUF58 family)
MSDNQLLRVLVMREADVYVAQCLEYDICTQAADLDTLFMRMTAVVNAECEETRRQHGVPFKGIDPAPAFYFDTWERSNSHLSDDGLQYKFAA